MNRFNRIALLLAIGAGLIGAELVWFTRHHAPQPGEPGYVPQPGDPPWVWQAGEWRMTKAQTKEWGIMAHNLSYGSRLAWHAAMTRAMLVKANWLANRLNLPTPRPIQESEVNPSLIGDAAFRVLRHQYPSWIPDTVYGTNIYNTNISRLDRILALKIGIGGTLDTPDFEFTFEDGQLAEIVRRDEARGERYSDKFAQVMSAPHIHPPLPQTYEVYQTATDYLAAVDINLDMLEKSRLPNPVRQEEYQPAGASDSVPVYFVAWGTNYYGLNYLYHYWHTNEWRPAVMVEIGPHHELLEIHVGDPTFFRDPPTIIPSQTNWRLVHTPDPPPDQLTNAAVMREFFLTPELAAQSARIARNGSWDYRRIEKLNISSADKAELIRSMTNELNYFRSILIPYKPGDDPVWDTNQP